MYERFESILNSAPAEGGECIGLSRELREILAFRIGSGGLRVSLIGGCHADEPTGPLFLRHLCSYLLSLPKDDLLVRDYEWWVIPHLNPDGEARNEAWCDSSHATSDLVSYLRHSQREAPGDDIEFGFPSSLDDVSARPENRCAHRWWSEAEGVFHCHGSLHSMHLAAGPWFLIEPAWVSRCDKFINNCRDEVLNRGYRLHDVQRNGDKGFHRIAEGFCTRPDSEQMAQYFLSRNDVEMATRFRPSSMESIRSLGGDAFTFVSEMPVFIAPGIGENIGPPDLVAERWKTRLGSWRAELQSSASEQKVRDESSALGLVAMPLREQMRFQWLMIAEAINMVSDVHSD